MAIRRSARRSHKLRHGTNDQQAELLCCLLVKARYPNARQSLCNQLGASIYLRGTSLLYLKLHNEKLASERDDQTCARDVIDEDLHLGNNNQESEGCTGRQAINEYPFGPLGPVTIPSTLNPSMVSRIAKTKNNPSSSIVSRGWTVRKAQDDSFYYPPKPKMANHKRYQSCNLCADPLEQSDLTQDVWEYVLVILYRYLVSRANMLQGTCRPRSRALCLYLRGMQGATLLLCSKARLVKSYADTAFHDLGGENSH